MLYRNQLRDAIVAILRSAGTLAGDRVYAPRDIPVTPAGMPLIVVSAGPERKESSGRHAPLFTVTATILVEVTVRGSSATDANDQLDQMCERIEESVIGNAGLYSMIQQISAVSTETDISAESKYHLGQASVSFDLEFVEQFTPVATSALNSVFITASVCPGSSSVQADIPLSGVSP